jgi:FdhD protein
MTVAKLQKTTLRYNRGQVKTEPDWLAAESPVTIIINGKQYLTLLATPEHLDGLAAGFCLAEGLINKKEDILRLSLFQENDRVELELAGDPELVGRLAATRVLTTGCGKGTRFWRAMDSLKQQAVTTRFCLKPAAITDLMSQFNRSSPLFDETGAVHAAALANTIIQVLREDVARHNAVDKLIGHLVLNQADGETSVF